MGNAMLNKVQLPRRICPVIFMLDTSGSMYGAPIGAVNAAIEGVLPELISMNENSSDVEIKVAVMNFDDEINWMISDSTLLSPEELKSNWKDLDADGLTSLGAAFTELNNKLSKTHGFMMRAASSYAPVIFLLSDGEPTDNYSEGLKLLKQNNWYKYAARIAIGYGEESRDDILREFTGNVETVLHTDNPQDLKKFIRFATITSTMVASGNAPIKVDDLDSADDDPNIATNNLAKAITSNGGSAGIASVGADEEW